MVNRREKIYWLYKIYFGQTAILFLYFFNFVPFLSLFSSFFPYHFRFNFVVSERNVHILFLPTCLGGTFSPLCGTFFPGGRGGCMCTQCTHPPCVRACEGLKGFFYNGIYLVCAFLRSRQTCYNSAARTWRHEKSTPAEGRTDKLQTVKGMYGD